MFRAEIVSDPIQLPEFLKKLQESPMFKVVGVHFIEQRYFIVVWRTP